MSNLQSWKNLKLETPATYRIRVQGHIADSWSDRLADMIITRAFTGNNQPMTILVGHLIDKAALSGVLNALDELHLPLLTVENLDEKQT